MLATSAARHRRMSTKGAGTSACNVDPAKVERWRNGRCLVTSLGSDLQLRWLPEGGKYPGLRKSVSLRGVTPERRPWGVREGVRSIQPFARRTFDVQGYSNGLD